MAQTRAASQCLLQAAQILTVLLSCFSVLRIEAAPINLRVQPDFVEAEVDSWAGFNCSLPCEFRDTFTLSWLAGDAMNFFDRFLQLQTNGKISYLIEEGHTCDSDEESTIFWNTLKINVNTIDLDRTPVQCVAFPKLASETTHYGSYSYLKVSGPEPIVVTTECNPTEVPATTESDPSEQS